MRLRKILIHLVLIAAAAAASVGSFVGAHNLSVAQAANRAVAVPLTASQTADRQRIAAVASLIRSN